MNDLFGHTLTVFLGFLAIMNPIANTPVFLGLTSADDPKVTRKVARNAMMLTFAIITVFCLLGKMIFEMFGITLPAFRITGGLLVGIIGYQMLQGEQSSVHSPSSADLNESLQAQLSVAVSPLAVPILAGPGTIATAMNFAASGGLNELVITIMAFALLCIVTYFCFVFGQGMVRFLGVSGLNVVTRMMGLILAVIGVQMLIDGVKTAFDLAG